MAKKLKIVELDMEIGTLLKKASTSRTELNKLRVEIKEMKKGQREAQKAISKSADNLDKLTKAGMGSSRAAQFLRDKIKKSNEFIDNSNHLLTKNEATLKTVRREYNLKSKVLQAYSDKKLQDLEVIKQTDGSITQLSAALSKNKEIYKSLSKDQRENKEVGGVLLEIIQQQDEEYKALNVEMGNTNVLVGNYKKEIEGAIKTSFNLQSATTALLGPFGSLSPLIIAGGRSLMAYVKAQRASMVGTSLTAKALKLFRIALISTGVGAIVVLLASLVAYFTQTQDGINKVNRILVPFKVLFQSLRGVFQNVGKSLVDAFNNPKKVMQDLVKFVKNNLINRFKAFGVILEGIISLDFKKIVNGVAQAGTGVEDVIGKTKNLGKKANEFLSEALKRGQEIQRINEELSRTEADFILQVGKSKEEFKAQNKIAEDTTKTFEERETAAIASIKTLKEINKLQRERNELEVERLKLQFQSDDTSDEDRAELARKINELQQANEQMLENETTQQNKLNGIRDSAKAKEKSRIEEIKRKRQEAQQKREQEIAKVLERQQKLIDKSKIELDVYYQTNIGIANSLQERVTLERRARDKRLEFLKEETEVKIKQAKNDNAEIAKIKAEAKREELSINQDFLKAQAELTTEHSTKELENWIKNNDSKIEDSKRLTDELVSLEEERLRTIYDKKIENLEKEKQLLEEAGQFDYLKKQEYDQAKLDAESEYQDSKKEITENYDNQKSEDEKAKRALEFENRLLNLESENASEFEVKEELALQNYEKEKQDLEQRYADGLISKENFEKEKTLTEERYAQARKEINEAVEKAKVDGVKSVFGQMKDVLGEQTALGKASAIAETTIATYQSATNAYKSMSGIPVIGPTLGIAASALAIGMGLKNIQKIGSVNPKKAEKGITLSGPSHASGGIDLYDAYGNHVVEAEGGENIYVLNKRASKEISALSGWNQAFGGISLSRSVNHASTGGMVGYRMARSGATNVNSNVNLDAEAMAKSMMPYLSDAVKQGATLGTHSGSMVGIQEKQINTEIAKSANHG